MLQVGAKAPDFTAPSTIDNELTLSKVYPDKIVVLAFYPLDFTGG